MADVWTAEDMARRLGKPVSAVWAYVLEGELPLPSGGDPLALAELAALAGTDTATAARMLSKSLAMLPGDAGKRQRILAEVS